MKGLICRQQRQPGEQYLNIGLPLGLANKALKSSGHQAGRDLVILLQLEGQRVNVCKLKQPTGVSKEAADIYEVRCSPAKDSIKTEIMIYSPSSVRIEESGLSPIKKCLRPLTFIWNALTNTGTRKNMGGKNVK